MKSYMVRMYEITDRGDEPAVYEKRIEAESPNAAAKIAIDGQRLYRKAEVVDDLFPHWEAWATKTLQIDIVEA